MKIIFFLNVTFKALITFSDVIEIPFLFFKEINIMIIICKYGIQIYVYHIHFYYLL